MNAAGVWSLAKLVSWLWVPVTPVHNGVALQARSGPGMETVSNPGSPMNAPYWLPLRRTATTFVAPGSGDGVTWTQLGSYEIAMGLDAHFGFAVTSHYNARTTTSVFSDPYVR